MIVWDTADCGVDGSTAVTGFLAGFWEGRLVVQTPARVCSESR